ncbi:MAG TPA: GNAT family N-acetyltransferase [Streptosporangiaceae bacterium]|nr:GNAT family N-acetyltransferase [Streptosporangiaceae bacterium]
MSVRRLGIADAQSAGAIIGHFTGASELDPWDFLADPYTLLMVATEGGMPVGWLYGHELLRPAGGRMLLIAAIEVEVPARRRGHGRALLEAALGVAKARGHVEVVAPAGPGDPGARALFAGAGARQAHLRQLYRWSLGVSDSAARSR